MAGYTSVYDLEYAPAPPSLCFCSLPKPEELLSSRESLDPPILEDAPPGVPPVAPEEDDDAAAVAAAAAAALWAAEEEEPGMVRVLWGRVELLEAADAPPLPPPKPPVAPPEQARLDRPVWPMARAC